MHLPWALRCARNHLIRLILFLVLFDRFDADVSRRIDAPVDAAIIAVVEHVRAASLAVAVVAASDRILAATALASFAGGLAAAGAALRARPFRWFAL